MMAMDDLARLRADLRQMLGIPAEHAPLEPEFRGSCRLDGVVAERWIWTSEPGSRVTSILYMPENRRAGTGIPGMVIANGHGGSKNSMYTQYAGQLYAKAGVACLVHDTIGEEERHIRGETGTRAHDHSQAVQQADRAGRLIMGKMVYDALRAVDFLSGRAGIDPQRIGAAGYSLGGTVVGWMLALDSRLKVAVISGSGFADVAAVVGKPCWYVPDRRMLEWCDHAQLLSLGAPHCAVLIMNGERDDVVCQGSTEYWEVFRANAGRCAEVYERHGHAEKFKVWFRPDGGHRAYHVHKEALEWIVRHLEPAGWTPERVRSLPEISLEQWLRQHGLEWPEKDRKLYWVPLHNRGDHYPDMGIRPFPAEQLHCLRADEVGARQYTLEGWLELIDGRKIGNRQG